MPTHSSAKPAVAWPVPDTEWPRPDQRRRDARIERDLDLDDNGSTIESRGGGCMLAPAESQPSVRRRGEDVR
jgi:hypothetical protein